LRGVLATGTHIVNHIVALAVLDQYPRDLVGKCSRLSDAVVREMCESLTIPKWSFGGGIQGTAAQASAVKAELRRAVRGLGRLNFITDQKVRILDRFSAILESLQRMPRIRRVLADVFRIVSGKSIALLPIASRVHSVMQG